MNQPEFSPGYVWFEPANNDGCAKVDLQSLYPISDPEALQDAWNKKNTVISELPNGTVTTVTTFNKDAGERPILWLPGWGVSNLEGGGSSVATVLATLNPNRPVMAVEELANVPERHKQRASKGDMSLYASNYMNILENCGVEVLSGHSRGGIILAELAKRSDVADISVINLMDMPRARGYHTTTGFGFRIGLLDNLVQKKYADQVSLSEEEIINSFGEIAFSGGPKEALGRARDQWWIIRAMAKSGLQDILEEAIKQQPLASLYIWHGNKSIGAPVSATRHLVGDLRRYSAKLGIKNPLRYFESSTGHYTVGHTARCGRQTAFSIEQSGL